MRKIKLQMTISIDGFVKSKFGGPDIWDNEVTDFCVRNLDNVDTILLGRNTAEGFVPYWKDVAANPEAEYFPLGKPLTEIPKIVFSNTIKDNTLENTSIVSGDLNTAIKKLKSEAGRDIMVYGGVSFVSSLIQYDLVDEFSLLYYPYAGGEGDTIFDKQKTVLSLSLKTCKAFPCGIVLLEYVRNRENR
jgi:dihydrofolate reductase